MEQVAILIDGDNVSSKYAPYIKQEALQFGNIKICRMYGSITSPSVKAWYKVLPEQGISPILQISYANGKSVADQALTIDAMDLLYTGNIDVFCIVSSDSDFTKLAYRLKEAGKKVVGMGEQKTKEALAKACNEFKILDIIYDTCMEDELHSQEVPHVEQVKAEESDDEELDLEVEEVLPDDVEAEITIPPESDIVAEIVGLLDDDEWVNLASIGLHLSQRRPGFDSRNYGYRSMSMFIKKHEAVFETKKVKAPNNIHNIVYIRKKSSQMI
jgi:uncharacterized protein (TIGR00288 family)